ncbi:MAG: DegT/DnrJ/EryC1/StrS family aminotransferase [Acidobacteria bacterium]|nr:DegT/DnrJ/EryC1/StrS family aminotransferase [Acidobacteriota bacterium]
MECRVPVVHLKAQYQTIREEVEAAVRQVLEHQAFILGPEVEELEQVITQRHGCRYGVACASGSDALLLSLMALGIGPGDSVMVPAFTFFATASSAARLGVKPLFVDIDPRTFTLSPAAAEAVLHSGKSNDRIKAMIPVHLYGQCADMDPLLELARKHGLVVMEDAAQAILAQYRQRAAGSMGACGCFSFFPTKNLGGYGDGGMITTSDVLLAERLRQLRVHGAENKQTFAQVGINSRLDTLQAAILLVKMRHLEEWTEARRQKAVSYRKALEESGLCDPSAVYPTRDHPVVLPYEMPSGRHVYHQFTVRALRREELAEHLAGKGIETAVYYPVPLHRQPAFAGEASRAADCPESERAAKEVLSLPLYPELTEAQQGQVVQEIRSFYASR